MRLSEAILTGCELSKPLTDKTLIKVDKNGQVYACALGAAGLAAGLKPNEFSYVKLYDLFPALGNVKVSYKADKYNEISSDVLLMVAIWAKNDKEKQSREEIADYVASLGY